MDSNTPIWASFIEKLLNNPDAAKDEIIELEKTNHELAETFGDLDDLLHKNYIRRELFEETISKLNNMVLQFALQNYNFNMPISNQDDLLDSLITSLNMLGDELNYSTITSHYLLDIFNSYPDLIIITDELGIIQNANKKTLEFLNRTKKDLIKTSITDLFLESLTFKEFSDIDRPVRSVHFSEIPKSDCSMSVRLSPLIRKNNYKAGWLILLHEAHNNNGSEDLKEVLDLNPNEYMKK